MSDLDRVLNELGVIAQPPTKPQPPRRDDPSKSAGVWYRDGNIPH